MSASRELERPELELEPQERSGPRGGEEVGASNDSSNRSLIARRRWVTGLLKLMVSCELYFCCVGLFAIAEKVKSWSLDSSQMSGADWGPGVAESSIYGGREREALETRRLATLKEES